MVSKNKTLIHISILLFFCVLDSFSQNVFEGVYTKEHGPTRIADLSWEQINSPKYFFDSTNILYSNVSNYYEKYFSSAPINFKECIYISPFSSLEVNKPIGRCYYRNCSAIEPSSFLLYTDTLDYKSTEILEYPRPTNEYLMYLKLNVPLENFYQPFYFKKTEVTNREYREFVHWVLDSIIREHLIKKGQIKYKVKKNDSQYILNKKEPLNYNEPEIAELLEELYLPKEERFYTRRQFDSRKINYEYQDSNNKKCIINIYPDTLAWVNDFSYSIMEPYTNMYFWHPLYDDYPVVGITQHQANAFLMWKTKQMQDELDKKHILYTIKYELPNEMEWEMMATKNKKNIYADEYNSFYDNNYQTALLLKNDSTTLISTVPQKKGIEENSYKIFAPAQLPTNLPLFTNESQKLKGYTSIYIFN